MKEIHEQRKQYIKQLLSEEARELKHSQFWHYLKSIDNTYLQEREDWALRQQFFEDINFPQHNFDIPSPEEFRGESLNERIFHLFDDAKTAYTFGAPKAATFSAIGGVEQWLKEIYLRKNNYSEDAYLELEGTENKKGLTFGQLKNKFKEQPAIYKDLCTINKIRNYNVAHIPAIGTTKNNENAKNNFLRFIKKVQEILSKHERQELKKQIAVYKNQKTGLTDKEFETLVLNSDILRYNQHKIEYEIDCILAKKTFTLIERIKQELNE